MTTITTESKNKNEEYEGKKFIHIEEKGQKINVSIKSQKLRENDTPEKF